jgi:hypothetical protein
MIEATPAVAPLIIGFIVVASIGFALVWWVDR